MFQPFRPFITHHRLLFTLVSRELKARYRSSVLGLAWSLLNPLIMVLIYSVVFNHYLRFPWKEKAPYELYLFCGILPWTWFAASLLEGSQSLLGGGAMIKAVRFPAELLPASLVLSNGVNALFGFLILISFLTYSHLGWSWNLLWLPLVAAIQCVLTLGLAIGLAALTVFFRDLQYLVQNGLMLGFYMTPILYKFEMLENIPFFAKLLYWTNPMAPLVRAYQDILLYLKPPQLDGLAIAGLISVACFLGGLGIMEWLRDSLAEGL